MFVDIGLKNDALMHISKMRKEEIKHPREKYKVGDIIRCKVIGIEKEKGQVKIGELPG